MFLDRGADPITGYPIYRGFQNVLKPIIAVYKTNIDKVPALQLRADMALRYFAKKGNLRCVSLFLWAGARPNIKFWMDEASGIALAFKTGVPTYQFISSRQCRTKFH